MTAADWRSMTSILRGSIALGVVMGVVIMAIVYAVGGCIKKSAMGTWWGADLSENASRCDAATL